MCPNLNDVTQRQKREIAGFNLNNKVTRKQSCCFDLRCFVSLLLNFSNVHAGLETGASSLIPILRNNRCNGQGGAACSRSIGAAPPGMMPAHPPSLCFSATRQRGPTVWNRCRLLSGNGISCVCLRIGWFQFVAAPNYSPDQVVKLCETRPAPGPAFLAWPGLFPSLNVPG